MRAVGLGAAQGAGGLDGVCRAVCGAGVEAVSGHPPPSLCSVPSGTPVT